MSKQVDNWGLLQMSSGLSNVIGPLEGKLHDDESFPAWDELQRRLYERLHTMELANERVSMDAHDLIALVLGVDQIVTGLMNVLQTFDPEIWDGEAGDLFEDLFEYLENVG